MCYLHTYQLLRYGVSVQIAGGKAHEAVHLIDWVTPETHDFALAEEGEMPLRAAPKAKCC